nr:hypothetical protein BaRGS_031006 [Batillaria attramentaria]
MLVLVLLLNLACMLSCQSTTDGAPDSESATSSEDKSGAVSLTSEFGKSSQAPPGGNLCRDRSGLFPQDAFKKWTCGMCFSYLYNGQVKTVAFHTRAHVMVVLNATGQPVSVLTPHVDDPAVVEAVCAEVEEAGEDCSRWTQCCRAAEACCERQLASETPSGTRTHDTDGGSSGAGAGGYCPRTWDGYSCWDDTESGSNARKMCPSYIEHSSQDGEYRFL